MLEALHPGRIDLGIGRAPGTDPVTAAALRRSPAIGADEFPEQLRDLLAFFEGTHPQITAVPGRGYRPAMWMLGSSDYSAQVAGMLGLPFSFAHHFASANTLRGGRRVPSVVPTLGRARRAVRDARRARHLRRDDERAAVARPGRARSASSACARAGRRRCRRRRRRPSTSFTPFERELLRSWDGPLIVGDPDAVRAGLEDLAKRTGADELMVTTMVHGPSDRLRSYELVAEVFDLAGSIGSRSLP